MAAAIEHPPVPAEPLAGKPLRASRGERWTCGLLAAAALAVLGVAAWLTPSPTGVGTHRGLGLAPCGWIQGMSLPCPSCGMTTAFSLAVRGRFVASAVAQPMGFVLAVGTAAAAVACLHTALTGSRLARVLGGRVTPRVVLVLGIVAVLAWGWKIAAFRGIIPVPGAHA